MLPPFSYIKAKNLRQAVEHLATEGAYVHAGGTDLLGCLRERIFPADKLVAIGGLKELGAIHPTKDGGLSIGALATITDVEYHPLVKKRYPGLSQAASEVASPQLRNQGTLGGNLCQKPRCWYYRGEFHCLRKGGENCFAVGGENQFHCILGGDQCYMVHPSDTAPALIAFRASVKVQGRKGTRTVPVEELHVRPEVDVHRETVLEPDEVITEILLPSVPSDLKSAYRKVRARRSWDFALAGVAPAILFRGEVVEDARIVLSGVAPFPWRAVESERAIIGKRIDPETAREAARAAVKDAAPMTKNDYKVSLIQAVIEEQLLEIAPKTGQ